MARDDHTPPQRNAATTGQRITGPSALSTLADLAGASVAAGAIARRRAVVGLLERIQADRRSVDRLRGLRRTHGSGPLELTLPGRRIAVVLDPADVGRVLDSAPSPFDPASWEKRQALQQFQPHAVLITRGSLRPARRSFNEAVLDTGAELHHLAEPFAAVIREEADILANATSIGGTLTAARFTETWWRVIRRLVLGAQARDDDAVTDDLWRLRRSANWSFAVPTRHRRRDRFIERLYRYAEHADPDSLLGVLAATEVRAGVDPIGQVPHWLFAFDAAGMATIRAAALLAAHPDIRSRCETGPVDGPELRPLLRACVLESVRLWPTTPALLRESTEDTVWGPAAAPFTIAAGATFLICVPAFHRDPDLLPFADRFVPDIWLDGTAERYPQLVPFSAGPARCPGQNLVLFAASTMLAHLLGRLDLRQFGSARLSADAPLPLTLNQFGLEFVATPHLAASRAG